MAGLLTARYFEEARNFVTANKSDLIKYFNDLFLITE